MRPIHLSVSGLHSFREKQEVDFQSLCEGGVFGIFGPTGSGKSSLLDAVTLALYGKVERAMNNIQGIMNHAENEIHVSFTFELGNAEHTSRYRVERSFKRTSDLTLRTSLCRLLDLTEESIVIADKNNEVNIKVQELLGLTIDDFTRAVVLPQGKFAEFLSLKGTDRRQMLQRLFHLEQYGDQLMDKLRHRTTKARGQLDTIVAEQQGLGDASEEAMQVVNKRLKQAEELLLHVEQQRKEIEATFDTNQKIWQWQDERGKVEQQLTQLEGQKQQIVSLEQRLFQAQGAQQLKPYVDEWEQGNREVNDWTTKHEANAQQLIGIKAQEHEHTLLYRKAVKEREEQQPYWIERQSELKQAQIIQNELQSLQADNRLRAVTIEVDLKQVNEQREQLEVHHTTQAKYVSKQNELKQQLEVITVPIEERERIRSANSDWLLIHNREGMVKEYLNEYNKKRTELQEREGKVKGVQSTCDAYRREGDSLFQTIIMAYCKLDGAHQHIQLQLSMGNLFLTEQQSQIERQKEINLANQLATQLCTGEACPVCGSLEHPHPAEKKDDLVQHLTEQLHIAKEWIERGNEQQHGIVADKRSLESLYQQLVDLFSEGGEFEHLDLMKIAQSQVAVASEEAEATRTFSLPSFMKLFEEIHSLVKNLSPLHDDGKRLLKQYGLESKHLSELLASYKSLQVDCEELNRKIETLQQEMNLQKDKWMSNYPQYHFDKIDEEQQKMDINDREAAAIKLRLDQSVKVIEDKEREIGLAKESLNGLQLKLAESQSIYSQKQEQIEQKQGQLAKQIGTQSIEYLLDEAINKLEQLKKQEQEAVERWQTSRTLLQQIEKEESVAIESLKHAQSRLQKALSAWEEVCEDSTFSTMDEVKGAVASKDEQAAWQRLIEQYRNEEKKWSQELARLHALLGDKRLTLEQWQSCTEQKELIRLKWDEVLGERGAAKQALNELEMKHNRYKELEQRRLQTEQDVEKLGKLQTVFRGNSFVEYIAEEQLMNVCRDASGRLGTLTRQRYALEVDSMGGFIIRDDANGGVKRPVSTLSGGETFLTALSLALSLSAQIQLRGQFPLEFFFLDEGFGTLDQDLLDTVVTALEHLHTDRLSVGVISHVPELRARLPRRLIVEPAEASGRGSRVYLETL